jgi:hypothetical protein
MTDKADWLAGLKKGDPVVVTWYWPRRREVQTVVRLTDTRIVTHDGLYFRRRDGFKPGGTQSYFRSLSKPTAAQVHKASKGGG